jgi:cell division septation protein DedD
MKHRMVTMRLHRNGVILAAVLGLLFAILVFVAGYLTARANPIAVRTATTAAPPQTTAQAPPAATQTEPPPATLTVRVGAFPDEADAKALAAKLAAGKIETKITPLQMAEGATLHLVIFGHYATREEAVAAAARVEEAHDVAAAVIPIPP